VSNDYDFSGALIVVLILAAIFVLTTLADLTFAGTAGLLRMGDL